MKYERTAKREASDYDGLHGRFAKQQAAGIARRTADQLMREEDADTSVPIWEDPVWIAFMETPAKPRRRRMTLSEALDEAFARWSAPW